MRATIIVDDNLTVVDGMPYPMDCSSSDFSGVHAIQWYGTRGDIEYRAIDDDGNRPPNKKITDFSTWQPHVEAAIAAASEQ